MKAVPGSQSEWRSWIEEARPSLAEQMGVWLALPGSSYLHKQCELSEGGASVLLRNSTNGVEGFCLVIATVRLEPEAHRKGWFKALLHLCLTINPWPRLIIEDVENPHLREFLERIGGVRLSDFYPSTFEIPRSSILLLGGESLLPYTSYVLNASRRYLRGDSDAN